MRKAVAIVLICALLLVAGCSKEAPTGPKTAEKNADNGAKASVEVAPDTQSTDMQVDNFDAKLAELDSIDMELDSELDSLDEDLNFEI